MEKGKKLPSRTMEEGEKLPSRKTIWAGWRDITARPKAAAVPGTSLHKSFKLLGGAAGGNACWRGEEDFLDMRAEPGGARWYRLLEYRN